ncbi:MAG: hypothetical protein HPY71_09360 [Firmicutes bacterium]|nr:hypothetical protein [Bacillota bacterium]
MKRKQIYLDEKSDELLKKWANLKDVSEASIIREAVNSYLVNLEHQDTPKGPDDPLIHIVGMYEGEIPPDVAINHDKYIYRKSQGSGEIDE